ncbi:MAG: sulfotransferase [Pseudoxanthomonas suwonensis]|nr:sulfotransferase [Pseudoxanthomonas suwonensis]
MTDPRHTYARAVDALNQGQWAQAGRLAGEVLQAVPDHAGVQFVAGVAAFRQGRYRDAFRHLEAANRLNPARADYAAQLAAVLSQVHMQRDALTVAQRAMALKPTDAMTFDTLGIVFTQCNEHAQAVDAYRQAVAMMPMLASYRFNLATSLMFNGRIAEAEDEYENCIAREPTYWKAHLALSQARRQDADRNHLPQLRELLDRHANQREARLYLNLALAKELEDLGKHPLALPHLVAGKAAGQRSRGDARERDRALFDALIRAFPASSTQPPGHPSSEPIFIIGMPRSGTTLVERIVSSHSQVHAAGELQNFGIALKRLSGSRTPAILDPDTIQHALALDPRALGEAYVESTRPGTGHVPRFIDKLPHNFLYAGFIARALPQARIICLRRNAMDTCLGNFRQLFATGNPHYDYSYDLLDTGRYFLQFERLMRHWDAVLPGRILHVDYEAIIEDQECCTRRLLEFCQLPWEDACLQFQDNAAPVATASVAQVREPLNRRGIGRWKRYGEGLDELRALLAAGGADVA